MRIVAVFLALAVVGLLLSRQLNTSSTMDSNTAREASAGGDTIEPPRVPQTPAGSRNFDQDINNFIDASKTRRDEDIAEKAR